MINDSYIKIDLDAIKHNVESIIKYYPSYKYYIGVCKGMAYGHGFYILNTLKEAGINYYAISSILEASILRKYDALTPVLCLEPIDIKDIELASKLNLTITVSDLDYGKKVLQSNFKGKVHIKLDTGMNRLGFKQQDEIIEFINLAANKVVLEGIYSHIASIGFYNDDYDKQVQCFEELTSNIDLSVFEIIHIDRSLTMQAHPKLSFTNGVRPGILMYGYDQMPNFDIGLKKSLRRLKHKVENRVFSETIHKTLFTPEPSFSLCARIMAIKEIHANDKVGYGGQYTSTKKETIAICGIGYADGLMLNHNINKVEINGKLFPIVGSINMKMISVLIDDTVNINDEVIIYGNMVSLQSCAKKLGVTSYKILCDASLLLERHYYINKQLIHSERGINYEI